jgi:hypothetical protein
MTEWNSGYTPERKDATPFNLGQFADHMQDQANCMEKGGWCNEARNLRKWAAELRDKWRSRSNRYDDLYTWDR